jgi:hypothetical protein
MQSLHVCVEFNLSGCPEAPFRSYRGSYTRGMQRSLTQLPPPTTSDEPHLRRRYPHSPLLKSLSSTTYSTSSAPRGLHAAADLARTAASPPTPISAVQPKTERSCICFPRVQRSRRNQRPWASAGAKPPRWGPRASPMLVVKGCAHPHFRAATLQIRGRRCKSPWSGV